MFIGMKSSSKIGGRMLRYEVSGPISADEESDYMWKRNVKKNEKQREKWEKNKKNRKRIKFGFGGTWMEIM